MRREARSTAGARTVAAMVDAMAEGSDHIDWAPEAFKRKVGLMQQSINSTAIGGGRRRV